MPNNSKKGCCLVCDIFAIIEADKFIGKDCSKKEDALQLIIDDFFKYFNMWKEDSEKTT